MYILNIHDTFIYIYIYMYILYEFILRTADRHWFSWFYREIYVSI